MPGFAMLVWLRHSTGSSSDLSSARRYYTRKVQNIVPGWSGFNPLLCISEFIFHDISLQIQITQVISNLILDVITLLNGLAPLLSFFDSL